MQSAMFVFHFVPVAMQGEGDPGYLYVTLLIHNMNNRGINIYYMDNRWQIGINCEHQCHLMVCLDIDCYGLIVNAY